MTVAIWVAFLGYSAAAIGLGWSARRRRGHDADYWTAGRNLRATEVGLSISAGFLSVSWSCVYAVQLAYGFGLGAVWLITIPWLVALAGIGWLSRRYHGLAEFSQPEMVGTRFGPTPRRLVAAALALVFLVWGGAEIYVAATLLSPAMGVPAAALIVLIGLVVGTYSVIGGFRAVVDTDKLQYGIVVLYISAMAWLALRGLATSPQAGGQGVGAALAQLLAEPPIGARSGASWLHLGAPGLVIIVLTFVAYVPGWLFETDLWLRVQAARDARSARRGVWIAAANSFLFLGLLPIFIGVAALAIFPPQGDAIPAVVGAEGDAIFAALVERFAPAWLALVVAVGLVAAAMSTIDTCTNVMALSVAYDLLDSARRAPAAAARLSRRVTVAAVAAACLFALNTESLWDIFYLSSGILTTAVAFPVAAVFLPAVRARAVTASSAAGLLFTFAAYFLETYGGLLRLEPVWLAESGLGFIFWGGLAATAGALVGQATAPRPAA